MNPSLGATSSISLRRLPASVMKERHENGHNASRGRPDAVATSGARCRCRRGIRRAGRRLFRLSCWFGVRLQKYMRGRIPLSRLDMGQARHPGTDRTLLVEAHAAPLVKHDCCISGSRDDISARDLVAEDKTDRPGSDYKNFRDGLVGKLRIYVRCRTALLVLDIPSTWRPRAARPLLAERRRRPSHREPEYGRRREVQNTHGLKPWS